MTRQVTLKFWIESAAAAAGLVLFLTALIWPKWIEAVFGVEPDGGNGSLEFLVAVVPLVFAIIAGGLAHRQWRQSVAPA